MMGKVSSRRKKENTSLRPKTTSSDDDHVVRVDCFGSNATDRQVIFIFQKYTSPPPPLNIGQRAPDRGITFKFFSYFDWIWSGEIVLGRQSSVRARAARWTLISTCSCVDRRPTTAVTSPIEPKKFPKMRSRVTYKWPMTIHESRNDREMFFFPRNKKIQIFSQKIKERLVAGNIQIRYALTDSWKYL